MAPSPRPKEGVLLNNYELAVLYHPDLEIDLAKAEDRVKKIITDNGGKITKTDNWGKRKLAYPIAKQEFAVYVFYTVEMPAENVAKVEQIFNITDEIVRFLITRPDLKAAAKAEALKAEKAAKAAERGDREDGEEAEETEEPRPRRRARVEE
jgi:small subunit ribosomal protein S6